MIVMVGCPGSGKSSFVKSDIIPKDYTHVNRDTLKTAAKCMSVAEDALQSGKSVSLVVSKQLHTITKSFGFLKNEYVLFVCTGCCG